MVNRTVPKRSILRKVSTVFDLDYQIAGDYAGQYLCTDTLNQLMPMIPNNFYLLDNVSISGTIPIEVFVNSLILTEIPFFRLRHYVRNELITAVQYDISQYYEESNFSSHVICNKGRDGIAVELSAALNQVIETIGVDTISLALAFGIYEISSDEYNAMIRGKDIL